MRTKRRPLLASLALLAAMLPSGCGTLVTSALERGPRPCGGTLTDVHVIARGSVSFHGRLFDLPGHDLPAPEGEDTFQADLEEQGWLRLLAFIDLPLSLGVDVLFLPISVPLALSRSTAGEVGAGSYAR